MRKRFTREEAEDLEHLRSLLTYDPETGLFRWNGWYRKGQVAGTVDGYGYIRIAVKRKDVRAHRIAFAFMTGEFPDKKLHIDHINGNRADNRWANLRLCSAKENQENAATPKNSSSGLKGVSRSGAGWRAYICHNRRQIHLGCYRTKEEAHRAYCDAAINLGWAVHRP